jgi:glycosyltransferase involved in cell wall biosynthesis
MRIAFVLPGVSVAPVGGYKVVYTYANLLAGRGHEVSVTLPVEWDQARGPEERLRRVLRLRRMRRDRAAVVPWMELDERVGLVLAADRTRLRLPAADALVATSWVTAPPVAEASDGRGFYLLQGYETWGGDAEAVRATWRLPLGKIAVSRWLREIAVEMGEGERTAYVPIGLDLERWGVDRPLVERGEQLGIGFSPFKDPAPGIAALAAAHERLPEVSAVGFGTGPRPESLPEWVDYRRSPSQVELRGLYNSCAVFLQAGGKEGWGLPPAEAMACGCALVSFDTGGSREYAEDGVTAVVVDGADPAALGGAAAALLGQPERLAELAARGRERVASFTWERAVAGLEAVLAGEPAGGAPR